MAKFKRLPFIKKIGLIVSLPLSLLFYTYLFRTLLTNHLMQESFLEVWKCPACYGQSMCSRLMSGNYTFVGLSSIRFFDYTNVKNTHFIKSQSGKIVLKKLGHDSELKTLDKQICTDAGYDADYDCSRAVYQTKPALKREVSPTVIKGLSPAMHCVSQRLVDRILKYYTERKSKDEFHIDDKMQLVTTLKINAEPIIMQTFPASEGYPFPTYIGSCGRFTAVEYVGPVLGKYYDTKWEERIDYAYQLIYIAELLTNNDLGFSFYLTDVTYDNFAVNRDGKIVLIDLEDILIVDKAKIRNGKIKLSVLLCTPVKDINSGEPKWKLITSSLAVRSMLRVHGMK